MATHSQQNVCAPNMPDKMCPQRVEAFCDVIFGFIELIALLEDLRLQFRFVMWN